MLKGEKMTLHSLIEGAMREASGVWDDAVESLRKKLRGNKNLPSRNGMAKGYAGTKGVKKKPCETKELSR